MTKEKIHTTNYFDTFIEVAEGMKATFGKKPTSKSNIESVAELQYELLISNPYKFTSDGIIFQVYATRNDLTKIEYDKARDEFFSKGQPCFRASLLTKSFGFGVHSNRQGKVALFGMETEQYMQFLNDRTIKKVKAMRTSKK